jgi:rhodanese-related sulfurtransferase
MPIARVPFADLAAILARPGAVYLDVRTVPEFEESHPAGAYNVPLLHLGSGGMIPNPDFLAVVERHFPKDTPLVIGCRSGGRSARAATALESRGFTALFDYMGGFGGGHGDPGWEASGGEVERTPRPGRDYDTLRGA